MPGARRTRAWIGLGANLGASVDARLACLHAALAAFPSRGLRLTAASSVYASPPLGGPPQRPYLNAAVAVETSLGPRLLLRQLRAIELARGRRRGGARNAPRPLDLDLLLYARVRLHTPELILPHPRLLCRRFVLLPLLELGALPPPPGRWLSHPALRGQHCRRLPLSLWPPTPPATLFPQPALSPHAPTL